MEEVSLPSTIRPFLAGFFLENDQLSRTAPKPKPWAAVSCVRRLEKVWGCTYDSVLDTEPQLVAKVWSPDQHGGHWGTPHDIQLDPGLILQALKCE